MATDTTARVAKALASNLRDLPFVPQPAAMAMALAFAELEPIRRQWVQAGPAKFKALKIDDVYDAVRQAMAHHGIWPYARLTSHTSTQRGDKPVIWRDDIEAHIVIQSADGSEVVTGPWPARGENTQDKSLSVALSYLMKTALIAMFVIPGASEEPDENAPGETAAARVVGRSRPSAPRVDWRTTPHEFAGKLGKACPKCGKPQADDLHRQQESGRSADPETGEHNDDHEPTDDHDHGISERDAGLAEIGYAKHPESDDHWHPEAHSVTDDDWQADPDRVLAEMRRPAPDDEVPF